MTTSHSFTTTYKKKIVSVRIDDWLLGVMDNFISAAVSAFEKVNERTAADLTQKMDEVPPRRA